MVSKCLTFWITSSEAYDMWHHKQPYLMKPAEALQNDLQSNASSGKIGVIVQKIEWIEAHLIRFLFTFNADKNAFFKFFSSLVESHFFLPFYTKMFSFAFLNAIENFNVKALHSFLLSRLLYQWHFKLIFQQKKESNSINNERFIVNHNERWRYRTAGLDIDC